MSQHNFDISNVSRSLFRAEVNNGLKALATLSSGSTAPATTYAFQMWMDTSGSPAILKVRDAANSAWVTLGPISDSTQWRAYTDNTERVRIDSTGKMGIGKTNPAYTLDVNGDINCSGTLRINGTAVGTIADGSITYAKIQNVSANAVLMRNAGTDGAVAAQVIPESALVGRGPGQVVGAVTLGTGLSMSANVLNAFSGRMVGRQVFTASGTYTKATNNPNYIVVEGCGGGGGGGGNTGAGGTGAGGGGGGGYFLKYIPASSLAASETVTVGERGSSPASDTSSGGTGGTTSFGSHASATGGNGGGANGGGGGNGGTATGGDINLTGEDGYEAFNIKGGRGAAGFYGGGTKGAATANGPAPANSGAGAPGIGGSASAGNAQGGSGIVIVWEFA